MRVCPQCGLKYPDENERCFVDRADLVDAPDPYIGTTLAGRYLVEEKLGAGGMATVYRARHTLVDRPIAVKIMNPQLATDAALKERFRREAKTAAAVAHPNIIEIFDHGEASDGAPYLVMELLHGSPLGDLIARGPMHPDLVTTLGLQIAQGLARAHDFGVLHRDLKPDNVFVCGLEARRPVAKLLDFGIARSLHDSRLTNAGEIFGTPQYMAPERVTSIDAGTPADLYALGVIYFEMLTGRLPFEANEITGFFIKHMQDPPPKPSELVADCPRRLETLILALLEKKPEDRPVDAHQIIKELQALAPAARPSVGPPIPTSARAVAAPTLPPTTLDRWARRTALFDEMLRRAFPSGDAPAPIAALLEQIRASLRRVHELRSSGLKEQRKLEQMEGLAREGRERLGFAVQSLAEDLSQARADARQAQHDVAPYFESDAQAQAAQAEALRAVTAILGGGEPLAEPSEPLARALRAGADALDRWSLAYGPAIKARRWVESKEQLVTDLQFQVDALRAQLERSEASFDRDRAASEQILIEGSQEAERCEQALLLTASDFCAALRPRRELGDLFERLEADAG